MAATAVFSSVLTAGLPAVARAGYDAINSDKVDGKHAVSAGATQKARRGKLVATSPRTGRLPNDIIAKAPDSNRLDGLDSTAFLPRNGKASDADRLDGRDLRNVMPKSWTFDLDGVDGHLGDYKSVRHFTLSLPGPGQLLASGAVDLLADRSAGTLTYGHVWFNDTADPVQDYKGPAEWVIAGRDDTSGVWQRVPMVRTFDVTKAGDFTVHLIAGGAGGMRYHGGRAQFIFIPE